MDAPEKHLHGTDIFLYMNWPQITPRIGRLGRVRCEPGWRLEWEPDFLQDYDLWFIWAGRGTMMYSGGRVELRPGVCFWMRPGHVYLGEQDINDRLGVTFIHFELDGLDALPASVPEVTEVRDFSFFEAASRRAVQLMDDSTGPADSRRPEAEALLKSLLISLARNGELAEGPALSPARALHYRKMRALAALIRESPGTLPEIATLAREAGYSPAHFSRVFQEVNGSLPREFIIQSRIERGRQLLFESAMTVGEIATALGYTDIFFFSRQFKDRTGMSPSEFRAERNGRKA